MEDHCKRVQVKAKTVLDYRVTEKMQNIEGLTVLLWILSYFCQLDVIGTPRILRYHKKNLSNWSPL